MKKAPAKKMTEDLNKRGSVYEYKRSIVPSQRQSFSSVFKEKTKIYEPRKSGNFRYNHVKSQSMTGSNLKKKKVRDSNGSMMKLREVV